MRFLIDTNVVISGEPVQPSDIEPVTRLAHHLARLASGGHQLLVHPTLPDEIAHDQDAARLAVRREAIQRYLVLVHPPAVQPDLVAVLGEPTPGSHDWYDHLLLACVLGNAVHALVTQDDRIHRKARRLGIEDRVLYLADAVGLLDTLSNRAEEFIPSVELRPMHALPLTDPIFDSLRADYPAFDAWFVARSQEGRDAYVITGPAGELAAICVLKDGDDELGLGGLVTKLCTFKVAEQFKGSRYGELLLKAMFRHVHGRADAVWVTVFEKQTELIAMFEAFGFHRHGDHGSGEVRYVKDLTPGRGDYQAHDALDHHIRYGPPSVRIEAEQTFIVPIQPRFHASLFPDFPGEQLPLFAPPPHGNALRKAYLCRSVIRQTEPGATLLFYRSEDSKAVTTVGVLEQRLVSSDPDEIIALVGTRTVYSSAQVAEMAEHGDVLAMLFRQDRFLDPPITIQDLIRARAVSRAPQSIQHIHPEAIPWLTNRLDE